MCNEWNCAGKAFLSTEYLQLAYFWWSE